MLLQTFIRKQLRLKAHTVTAIEESDTDIAAASIDLDVAEEAEIDLEIEIDAADVHELTEDLSIDTSEPSSELTATPSPIAEEPVKGGKTDLFERSGAELVVDKNERNEG